jgi:GNAT superfamily N-acetyltransferase
MYESPPQVLPCNITIRRLDRENLSVLETLLPKLASYHNKVAASFSGRYPISSVAKQIRETEEDMAKNQALVEVVFRGDEPIGFAKGSFSDELGFIDWLYLEPSSRGMGLGGVLLKRIMAFFRKNRIHWVDIMVVAGNPARRFYEKHGFGPRLEMLSMALPHPETKRE